MRPVIALSMRPGIDIEGERIDINEDRFCPCVHDRVGGSNERQAGAEYFVSRTNPRGHECQVQSGRAGGNSHGFRRAHVLGKAPLEFSDSRSLTYPAAPENFDDSPLLRAPNDGRATGTVFDATTVIVPPPRPVPPWRCRANGSSSC